MRVSGEKSITAASLALAFALVVSTPVRADAVDDACAQTLANTAPVTDPQAAQKIQYCQAAHDAQSAADADSALWKVWAGVGVVCTYACVASFVGGPTSEYICVGANVLAAGTDAIVTKNFASALMGVGAAGLGVVANQASKKDIGACIGAASATVQAFTKYIAMNSSNDSVAQNLDAVKKLGSSATAATQVAGYSPTGASDAQSGASSTGGTTGSALASGTTNTAQSTSPCSGVQGSSNAQAIVQCAVASDASLPSFVSQPKFAKEFQKDSGKPLSDFLTQSESPSAAIGAASARGLSGAQATQLAQALDGLGAYRGGDPTAHAVYAGGGAASSSGGSDDAMAAVSQMMAGLMGQLAPTAPGEKPKGVSAVIFANQASRNPASLAEDKSLGIFDRVTFRYLVVGKKLSLWAPVEEKK